MACACGICGGKSVGNGTRSVTVLDLDQDGFLHRQMMVRRRRCVDCGATTSEGPDLACGRITPAAADRITSLALKDGYDHAAAVSGTSRATVTRIVEARAASALPEAVPGLLRVSRVDPRGLAVIIDARGSVPLAAFREVTDPLLSKWWSGASTLVLPDMEFLPVLKNAAVPGMRLCVHRDVYRHVIRTLIQRCAKRLLEMEGSPSERDVLLLSKPFGSLTIEEETLLGQSCHPGSLGHEFLMRHHSLLRTHDVTTLEEARSRLKKWLAGCSGVWSRIYAPVAAFLHSHASEVLAHESALASWPRIALPPASDPAALYSIRLKQPDSHAHPTSSPSINAGNVPAVATFKESYRPSA